jgi:hypothetical protein
MRLLLVHGRSQGGKDPLKLKAEWLDTLDRGLKKAGLAMPADVKIDFPFYGDRLDEFVRQFELPADPAIVPKGSPAFDEFAAFRASVAEEMRVRAGITNAQVQAECHPTEAEKGVQNWEWVQAIVRLLDRNFTEVSQTTIEAFLRDVFLYTQRNVVRDAINEIVSEMLSPGTAVVVGHSLGSIVAYNVLRAATNKVPLAEHLAQFQIRSVQRAGITPTMITMWSPCTRSIERISTLGLRLQTMGQYTTGLKIDTASLDILMMQA